MTRINVRGIPEAQKLLGNLSGSQLQNRVRRGTRAGAKVFREEVRSQARARADIPDRFAKTATKGHRTPVGTSTGPTSPLLVIFEGGADDHRIGAPGQVLTNIGTRREQADKATAGIFFARGPVSHPGMAARPLVGPVFEAKEGEATKKALDTIMDGIR